MDKPLEPDGKEASQRHGKERERNAGQKLKIV